MNGLRFAAAAFGLTAVMVIVLAVSGNSSQLNYGTKEILVTAIAFLTSGIVSYASIRAVRNGAIK